MSIKLSTQKILKKWTDFNGHMNVAYYLLIFDIYGADKLMNLFQVGEISAKTKKKSMMILESHITFNRELIESDKVDINLVYFDHDKRMLNYKLEMINKKNKKISSTIEILSVYVDLIERKISLFEDQKIKIMNNYIKKNKKKFINKNIKFSSKLIK
jgi:acyl-CoA thioester hydrolase